MQHRDERLGHLGALIAEALTTEFNRGFDVGAEAARDDLIQGLFDWMCARSEGAVYVLAEVLVNEQQGTPCSSCENNECHGECRLRRPEEVGI